MSDHRAAGPDRRPEPATFDDAADPDALDPDAAIVAESRVVLGAGPDHIERLTHSVRASTTGGVALVMAGRRSAVVKLVAPRAADPTDVSRSPSSFRYWRREALLLGSPLLEPYRAAGIRPPELLATFDRGAGTLALWIEHVRGRPGADWTIGDFGSFARRLGAAQGSVALTGPPDVPWLSRGFLRQYLSDIRPRVPYELLASDGAWQQPLIAASFPSELREPLRRLHAEQPSFVSWVEAVPRTLSHLDVWPNNAFATPDGAVLIDWAFAGEGGLGEDAGNLVPDSVFDLLHPAEILPELDRAVFEGYLDGLRQAGWRADQRWVRLAMCAAAVKYDWLAPVMLRSALDGRHAGYGGAPVEDPARLFSERGAALAFLTERAEEARGLAAELGLA